jgi:hypothetical protein
MRRRPQFTLTTMLWLMAVVAAWCMICRTIMSEVRDPIIRTASVCLLVVATVGIGCMANAARMKIGQDWQRGAVQLGWAVLGVAMLVSAAVDWFVGFWTFWMANAG